MEIKPDQEKQRYKVRIFFHLLTVCINHFGPDLASNSTLVFNFEIHDLLWSFSTAFPTNVRTNMKDVSIVFSPDFKKHHLH